MSLRLPLALALVLALAAPTRADDAGHRASRPDDHAPIGVMGDHVHHAGEVMLSYRFMSMSMEGNRDGTGSLSPEDIATTVSNPFFGLPMQPPTLRVVPVEMTMDMHMLGAMWAPSDRVTLMAMLSWIEKEMDHVTFQGGMGTTRLGSFTTKSSGLGDTKLSALVKLAEREGWRWHLIGGVSIPTGDLEEDGTVLAPTGMMPTLRLPYPMQLGSGTYDPTVGVSHAGRAGRLGWGGQLRSTFRVEDNDEDYRLGDEHRLTVWGSLLAGSATSVSARLEWYDRGNVDGMDPAIVAPVQTADPENQGVSRVDAGVGVNFLLPNHKHRLALEALFPVRQDLDGPQLETDWTVTFGYQVNVR